MRYTYTISRAVGTGADTYDEKAGWVLTVLPDTYHVFNRYSRSEVFYPRTNFVLMKEVVQEEVAQEVSDND